MSNAALIMSSLMIVIVGFFLYCLIFGSRKKDLDYGIKDNDEVRKMEKIVSPSFVLTRFEKPLFFLIQESFPQYILLTQVSFSAIIKCRDLPLRNQFNRSRLDFLICDADFTPIVVIELDDKSHKIAQVQEKDNFRDNLLSAAGIPTIRFQGLPSKDELRHEISCVIKQFEHREKLPTYKKAS